MAIAAAIVAGLYFVLYHGLLKPRCHAHTIQGPRQPPTIVQGKRCFIINIHTYTNQDLAYANQFSNILTLILQAAIRDYELSK